MKINDLDQAPEKNKTNIPMILLVTVIVGIVFAFLLEGVFVLLGIGLTLLFAFVIEHWMWSIIIFVILLIILKRLRKR